MERRARPWMAALVALLLAPLVAGCAVALTREVRHPAVPRGVPGRVMRSVVDVHVRDVSPDWVVEEGLGTGVVFSRDVIVTNDHVVGLAGHGAGAQITVETLDGRTAGARVVARFPRLDLAFLRVRLGGLRPARFVRDLDQIHAGDHVIAIGAPHHFSRAVTRGRILDVLTNVVVQRVPGLRALLESSARLRRGYSGGPMADAHGRVAGIDMATSTEPGAGGARALAIPAPVVLAAAARAGLAPAAQ